MSISQDDNVVTLSHRDNPDYQLSRAVEDVSETTESIQIITTDGRTHKFPRDDWTINDDR